jgi:hypothetical protein
MATLVGFTNYMERQMLIQMFKSDVIAKITPFYIGLSSTTPTEDSSGSPAHNFTEPSGGSYARQPMANTETTISALDAVPTKITNTLDIIFPLATANWLGGNNLLYFGLFDAVSGGNLLLAGALITPLNILLGNQLKFAVGQLIINCD